MTFEKLEINQIYENSRQSYKPVIFYKQLRPITLKSQFILTTRFTPFFIKYYFSVVCSLSMEGQPQNPVSRRWWQEQISHPF